jgi:hypothetical protein
LLVEQLLALIHSGVADFSQQVQRLRYGDGPPDSGSRNLDDMLWAGNAERRAMVKDIGAGGQPARGD